MMIVPDFQLSQLLDHFPLPTDRPNFELSDSLPFSDVMRDVQKSLASAPEAPEKSRRDIDPRNQAEAPEKSRRDIDPRNQPEVPEKSHRDIEPRDLREDGPRLPDAGERAVLNRIRDHLREKDIPADRAVVNEAALAALKRTLVRAGFDPEAVEAVFKELRANSGKSGIRLSELLVRLEEMEHRPKKDMIIDYSALPYIESILSLFLQDADKLKGALEGIQREGQGIDLTRLTLNLRQLLQQLPDKGRSAPDPQVQGQIAKLMDEMGIPRRGGILTLERFVSELQGAVAEKSGGFGNSQALAADLRSFVDNLQWDKETKKEAADPRGLQPAKTPVQEPAHAAAKSPSVEAHPAADPKAALEKVSEIKPVAAAGPEASKTAEASTVSAPAPKPPVRTLPSYVLNQVSRQILRSHQQGAREIQLQLNPPNLGRLQMRIEGAGELIRVSIVAEHQTTQELLASHSGDLKTVLMEQGIRIDRIEVQFDQFFDQSMAFGRQDANGRRQHAHQRRNPQPEEKETVRKDEAPEGRLDLVA